ncbi:class I SAM-dependent methyltransferase [Entomomonas sp. E2T0]|uniref:class I SAM-dependent methyltransferase n=1 Tax=Entomomonas sp. E2T0 TaxID=2930213 RepID=UPI0022285036|nr:class I SAM-dependent methyltransferase [Entomomonas sp. E2T0]UYZ84922.1 class I SAM-dependent methyltransferase [Entomomonas sp. E2T0]
MTEILPPNQQQMKQHVQSIRTWFASGKGQRLLSLEKPLIEQALTYYFGRFLLQAGPLYNLVQPIKDVDEIISVGCEGFNADIVCEEHAWPILTEGVEAVVLQHTLDFAYSPHNTLREAARCIRPGGHILIVGFNPYSYWGIYRRCHFGVLSKSHSITYSRLMDWLRLLGFAVERTWKGAYGLPNSVVVDKVIGLEAIGQHRKWWGNGFYIVSARKMMIQPTPLKSKKKSILGTLAPIPVVNRNDVRVDERHS